MQLRKVYVVLLVCLLTGCGVVPLSTPVGPDVQSPELHSPDLQSPDARADQEHDWQERLAERTWADRIRTQAQREAAARARQEATGAEQESAAEVEQEAAAQAGQADSAVIVSPYAALLEPVDPVLPPQGEVPTIWAPLDERVRAIAAGFNGRLSVVAVDLTTGARYTFRPHDRYLPASTFKLPVCLCTLEAIDRGELAWDSLITFTPADDDTVGQGGFAWTEYGTLWPVRNLFDRSIISSNNVAVKMLARQLTWDGLASCTEAIGGKITRTEWGSTPVSAPDEAAWWMHLWQMTQERPALAEEILRPLRAVTYRGRIQAGTPRPDLVTHKFGTLPPYENDGAIIWGERPYILIVMTATPDHVGVDWSIMQIAAAAWNAIWAGE